MSLNAMLKFNGVIWKKSRVVINIIGCRYLSSESENKILLLKELTGCSYLDAYKIIRGKKAVDKGDLARIKKTYSLLQDYGISNDDIVKGLKVLLMHPVTLQNHFSMLEEAGFKKSKINTHALNRFYTLFKSCPQSLKSRGYIDENTNVCDSYLKVAGLPSEINVKFKDTTPLNYIHIEYIIAFLKWKSEGTWDSFEIPCRLNYKSVRRVSKTFDLLTDGFGLSKEKIFKFPYVLTFVPENLETILKYAPKLSGHDIRDLVFRWPKILLNSHESLLEIDKHLQEYHLSKDAVLYCPAIFTLSPENVYNRLKYITSQPHFVQWMYHPQFLQFVLRYNKCIDRFNRLQDANMKCMSLFLLSSPENGFKRHIEHLDKSNQYDVVLYLSLKLSDDPKKIRKRLKKHPYWLYIPHKEMQETLLFLQKEGFSEKDILSNIVILLYPKSAVQKELSQLSTKSEFECCRNPTNRTLRKETVLPLLLYAIEHPFHFNKDAIWAYHNKESNLSRSSSQLQS